MVCRENPELYTYCRKRQGFAVNPAEFSLARAEVLSQLHGHIQDVFNEYGVQIMSLHYMMDPAEPQVVPRAQWHAPPVPPPRENVTASGAA